jgi:hypothetical protein
MDKKDKLEQKVAHLLTEGEIKTDDPKEAAVNHLSAKYEVRIQAVKDPIAAETEIYRTLAEEVDERYDKEHKKGRLEGMNVYEQKSKDAE